MWWTMFTICLSLCGYFAALGLSVLIVNWNMCGQMLATSHAPTFWPMPQSGKNGGRWYNALQSPVTCGHDRRRCSCWYRFLYNLSSLASVFAWSEYLCSSVQSNCLYVSFSLLCTVPCMGKMALIMVSHYVCLTACPTYLFLIRVMSIYQA